ncbi:MAG: lycopene cyclase domain-containing protein [Bacteroidota bacterium]
MTSSLHYLFLDLLYLGIPVLLSFTGKAPLFRKWKFLLPAVVVTAVLFFITDAAIASTGALEVNSNKVAPFRIAGLPLEHLLGFLAIAYAGPFIYHTLNHLIERDYIYFHHELISSALSVLFMVLGIYQLDKAFTGVAFLGLGLFLAFQMIVLKPRYMSRFYFATPVILIVLIPFYLFLTGTFTDQLILWHDEDQTLSIRLWTAPLEAIVYGWFVVLVSVTGYEWLKMRAGDWE